MTITLAKNTDDNATYGAHALTSGEYWPIAGDPFVSGAPCTPLAKALAHRAMTRSLISLTGAHRDSTATGRSTVAGKRYAHLHAA